MMKEDEERRLRKAREEDDGTEIDETENREDVEGQPETLYDYHSDLGQDVYDEHAEEIDAIDVVAALFEPQPVGEVAMSMDAIVADTAAPAMSSLQLLEPRPHTESVPPIDSIVLETTTQANPLPQPQAERKCFPPAPATVSTPETTRPSSANQAIKSSEVRKTSATASQPGQVVADNANAVAPFRAPTSLRHILYSDFVFPPKRPSTASSVAPTIVSLKYTEHGQRALRSQMGGKYPAINFGKDEQKCHAHAFPSWPLRWWLRSMSTTSSASNEESGDGERSRLTLEEALTRTRSVKTYAWTRADGESVIRSHCRKPTIHVDGCQCMTKCPEPRKVYPGGDVPPIWAIENRQPAASAAIVQRDFSQTQTEEDRVSIDESVAGRRISGYTECSQSSYVSSVAAPSLRIPRIRLPLKPLPMGLPDDQQRRQDAKVEMIKKVKLEKDVRSTAANKEVSSSGMIVFSIPRYDHDVSSMAGAGNEQSVSPGQRQPQAPVQVSAGSGVSEGSWHTASSIRASQQSITPGDLDSAAAATRTEKNSSWSLWRRQPVRPEQQKSALTMNMKKEAEKKRPLRPVSAANPFVMKKPASSKRGAPLGASVAYDDSPFEPSSESSHTSSMYTYGNGSLGRAYK